MVYNKADFKKHVETLKTTNGFKLKSAVQAYLFIRKLNDRTETITLNYRAYVPHGFYIDGLSVDIHFNEIEDIINPILDRHQIQNRYGETTIQKSLIDVRDVDYSKLQIQINNDETFDVVKKEVETIILNGALPFFEHYNGLLNVNETIENLNEEELSIFISGIVGIKIPLIKKLAQSNSFSEELKNRNEFYTKEVFRYPQYFKDHEKVFNELFTADLKALKISL